MKSPRVSILIPAYNARRWISYTLRSALGQTWPNKEVIVVDDGSTDDTARIAKSFSGVLVISTTNQGQSAALNIALEKSRGEYIQFLDADDLLAPNKIEKQMDVRQNRYLLLSCPWAPFFYRTRTAKFTPTSLWMDLSPIDWILRNLDGNVFMPPHTWLVSRELIAEAGPWNESLRYDQDGEYFARVLSRSAGTKFAPEAKAYYRASGTGSVSYIGDSPVKTESMIRSMALHMKYLQSLEKSDRVRSTCLRYMQDWQHFFYPEYRVKLNMLALEMVGETLDRPHLRKKYAWLEPFVGFKKAKQAQSILPQMKASVIRRFDKTMFQLGM